MTDVVAPARLAITIDGRSVETNAGEVIIAAAERAGIYIPRFCWHPRMKPVGMCRMCLVELDGPRGPSLIPACFVGAAEGQVVHTQETSTTAKRAQEDILELLLVNHPLDCPVCDKGGECPLQDQTMAHGPGETRFIEEKRHWEKPIALSPLVLLDRERCIQCARCTRFAEEIAGEPMIDFFERGERTEVAVYPDRPFSSYFSGNTVQICPVGALTAVPYRFRARPWDLETVVSTCTACAVGCRVAVQSSANRLSRVLGVDSDAVNQGWLCDKGRFTFEAWNSADRLTQPLVLRGEELVEASWSEALDAAAKWIAETIRLHGANSVAILGGARLANEDAYAWAKLARDIIGTDLVDAQLGDGLPAQVVLGLPRATIDEACNAGAVVLLGPDLREELPVLHLRLRAAVVDGKTRLVELAPRRSGLSRQCAVSLLHRPGDAASLARALAGADVAVAGVPPEAVAAARAAIEGRDIVVVLGRSNLAEPEGATAEAALALAEAFPNAKFLPVLRRANALGALEMGLWSRTTDGAHTVLTNAAEGRVGALVLVGADPISDFPDRELARRALAGAATVIAVDTFLNASTKQADVVLPAAGWSERGGTTTNIEGRITRLGVKLTPPGVAWPDWMVASELASRLGGDLGFVRLDDIASEVAALAPGFGGSGGTDGGLVDHGDRRFMLSTLAGDGATPAPEDAYSLRLVTGRVLYDEGTLVHESPSLAALAEDLHVGVNPVDLERTGLSTGDRARLHSARGSLVVTVKLDAGLPRGSVFLPWNRGFTSAADLIDSAAPVTDVRLESL